MEYTTKPAYLGVSFIQAIKLFFKNYANFEGRSSRSEYWWFYVASMVITMPLNMLQQIMQFAVQNDDTKLMVLPVIVMSFIVMGIGLGLLVPSIAICTRRLHDIGKSGWWQLIGFIPIVGAIILIVWFIKESEGPNQYGDVARLEEA